MWLIVQVRSTLKIILNYRDWSDQVQFLTNTKEEKYVTNCISTVHAKNNTELLWLIRSSVDCDESKIGQLCDWLCIFYVKKKLSYYDRLDQVWSRMKTNQDNDVTCLTSLGQNQN